METFNRQCKKGFVCIYGRLKNRLLLREMECWCEMKLHGDFNWIVCVWNRQAGSWHNMENIIERNNGKLRELDTNKTCNKFSFYSLCNSLFFNSRNYHSAFLLPI